MKNKPPYAIDSVDNALHLAQLLLREGPMRVTDAAARLGVSPSTAHRLLAMLVYRDFAERDSDRLYRPGTSLRSSEPVHAPVNLLRRIGVPHLERLVDTVDESANLLVLAGTDVRFVATVESTQVLRVGDRAGKALPAHLTSAGKAMLARLDKDGVSPLLDRLDESEAARVRRELAAARRNGYAVNNQRTEAGLTAVGVAIKSAEGPFVAGLSLAIPSVRFHKDRLNTWVAALSTCASAIERDIAHETNAHSPS